MPAGSLTPVVIQGNGPEVLLTWLLLLAVGGAGVATAAWLERERPRQRRATCCLAALLALGVVNALMLGGLGLSWAAWPYLAMSGLPAAVVAALGVARFGQRVLLAPFCFAAPCAFGAALGLADVARNVAGSTSLVRDWAACAAGHALVAGVGSLAGAAWRGRRAG